MGVTDRILTDLCELVFYGVLLLVPTYLVLSDWLRKKV